MIFMDEKKFRKILELEEKAMKKYISLIDWDYVMEALPEDEQLEYYQLLSEELPYNRRIKEKIKMLRQQVL